MKFKHLSFHQLILLVSICAGIVLSVTVLLSLAMQTKRLTKEESDKMAKTQLELFSANVRQEILTGSYAEVYRRCRALSVPAVSVRLASGRVICDENRGEDDSIKTMSQTIYFDEAKRNPLAEIRLGFETLTFSEIIWSSLSWGFGSALLASGILILINFMIFSKMLGGLIHFVKSVSKLDLVTLESLGELKKRNSFFEIKETSELFAQIESMTRTIVQQQEKLSEFKIREAKEDLARQVAHDIRSPLSALTIMAAAVKNLPENQRLMIREATSRINRIAEDLLSKGKAELKTHEKIGAILESLILEKRLEFKSKYPHVTVEVELSACHNSLIMTNRLTLQRAISNLINNSGEAIKTKGTVRLTGWLEPSFVRLQISDDGPGIPEEVLKDLGVKRVTFGKDGTNSGSGIGVLSAKQALEGMGAKLSISSRVGVGTTVDIFLPRNRNTSKPLSDSGLLHA